MIYDHAKKAWRFELRETKAKKIMRQCGIRMAALYLKNRGYTVEQAVALLLR